MKRYHLRDLSIRSKLILLGAAPSVVVLVIVAVLFTLYDLASARRSTKGELRAVAHFIASTAHASLRFNDDRRAAQILEGLSNNPEIHTAAIYDRNGELFASYTETGEEPHPYERKVGESGPTRTGPGVRIYEPIQWQGQPIGGVYIEADLDYVWARVGLLALAITGGLALFSVLAYLLSARFQQHISLPLQQLTRTASSVAEEGNYSVRVEAQPGPELSVLTRAFNQMLATIEEQDSALRQRAAQLEALNKELESFTYTVSHDLRSPLRAMAGYAQLLRKSAPETLGPANLDFIERIQKNARRMNELIDDLLAFSRLDSQPINRVEVDMAALSQRVVETLAPAAGSPSLSINIHAMPPSQGDVSLLEQALANLIGNALKYSRGQPVQRIEIGAMDNEGKPVYFVRDNGVGFDMQFAHKLFGVFQRLHRAEEFEGTGVGLAIVQRIINRHGGKVWAESSPGDGATFYFTLN